MRILLIEDDNKIVSALTKGLRGESFAVDTAGNGVKGEELAKINNYDIIILDVMLPKQDGWATCKNLREAKVLTPILMLTALDDVDDKIKGLNTGADDYLVKPFHFGELLARIRSLQGEIPIKSTSIQKYGLTLDIKLTKHSGIKRKSPLQVKNLLYLNIL